MWSRRDLLRRGSRSFARVADFGRRGVPEGGAWCQGRQAEKIRAARQATGLQLGCQTFMRRSLHRSRVLACAGAAVRACWLNSVARGRESTRGPASVDRAWRLMMPVRRMMSRGGHRRKVPQVLPAPDTSALRCHFLIGWCLVRPGAARQSVVCRSVSPAARKSNQQLFQQIEPWSRCA